MRKKKFIVLTVLLLLIILQAGCSSASSYQKNIYEDEKEIVKDSDSYSFVTRISTSVNERLSLKFGTFYGMNTIWEIESEGAGKVILDYSSEIEKGKFKCLLIDPNNEIIEIFKGSDSGSTEIEMKSGKSRIKIVGKDAGGEFEVTIKGTGDVTAKKVE